MNSSKHIFISFFKLKRKQKDVGIDITNKKKK